ncbi:hypothetical protein HAX54_053449 [Datura stramonium]|uniref:Uncharacterized protein n=1 Tax=Datura stramonium TaxID=4076 RepID=A0ABS8T1K9_DATST|nr:hypothetical protein [Datura stramonium]
MWESEKVGYWEDKKGCGKMEKGKPKEILFRLGRLKQTGDSRVEQEFHLLAASWAPNVQVICKGLAVGWRSMVLNRWSTGRALMLPSFYFYVYGCGSLHIWTSDSPI